MISLLKPLLKKFSYQTQTQYLESFDGELLKRLCKNKNDHIYQKLYNSSAVFIAYFFESSTIGRLLKIRTSKQGDQLEIRCQFPDENEIRKLSDIYKAPYGIGFETYQKLYLDRGCNFPKNVFFADLNGKVLLECNRFASIGNLSTNASRVNLIAGASETFQLVSRPQGASQNDDSNFLRLGFPFHEANETISNAIEGADFEVIVDSTNKLAKRLSNENIEIDIIAGTFGWHNLIYNQTSEKYWWECLNEIRFNCKKLCIFEIYSPILHLSNSEIISFSALPTKSFWGNIEPSEDSISRLRSAMLRFNNFINDYSKKNENVLVVPINNLCPINNIEFAIANFIDINHIVNNESIRAKLFNAADTHFRKNSKFFIPDIKKIPEYIYPLF